MTPPDSDAREVPAFRSMTNAEIAEMHAYIQRQRDEGFVILTPLLAQRILAALEMTARFVDSNAMALAAELRAVIGK